MSRTGYSPELPVQNLKWLMTPSSTLLALSYDGTPKRGNLRRQQGLWKKPLGDLKEEELMILHLCLEEPVEQASLRSPRRTHSQDRNQNLRLISFIMDPLSSY